MKTKLRDNQLKLLEHLARFEVLDYASCLYMLDTEKTGDTVALSYVFRPLTKNKYAVKYNDGNVRILAKGKRLFPDVTPLVTVNGSATGMKRAAYVSRVAMYLAEQGVESFAQITDSDDWIFIPSACWRQIRAGILSTTRFAGILFIDEHRLAVYDIGDGNMDWQSMAEHSLFYRKYWEHETCATGVLMICDERDVIERFRGKHNKCNGPAQGDYEDHPMRYFINVTTDLLKYTYFFATVKFNIEFKAKLASGELPNFYPPVNYAIYLPRQDLAIAKMYDDVSNAEGTLFYGYRRSENAQND